MHLIQLHTWPVMDLPDALQIRKILEEWIRDLEEVGRASLASVTGQVAGAGAAAHSLDQKVAVAEGLAAADHSCCRLCHSQLHTHKSIFQLIYESKTPRENLGRRTSVMDLAVLALAVVAGQYWIQIHIWPLTDRPLNVVAAESLVYLLR